MRVFLDSSVFVKRYIQEAGSDTVLDWCDRAAEIGLSGIAIPEISSAFCRLQRDGTITPAQYRQLTSLFLTDIGDIAVCDLTALVIRHAIVSLENNALRGMDAIHIGSAIAFQAEVFVTGDKRQGDTAASGGLAVAFV